MSEVRKESLGRMAVFLVPAKKLEDGIGERIERFLLDEYGGYTASTTNSTGWWKDDKGQRHYDLHRQYKASFPGKERIARLESFLADIARDTGEDCIYLETGEDAWLIYATEA